jgi:general secretion pathway protein G
MKSIMKTGKGGFTLVELLIVIMIIAILAGMMMLATGTATDTAEAVTIINDLRATKSAALLLYMDQGQSWSWIDTGNDGDLSDSVCKSLDNYMDRPLFTRDNGANGTGQYKLKKLGDKEVVLIGFELNKATASVWAKLAQNAERMGLYNKDSGTYKGTDKEVYVILH